VLRTGLDCERIIQHGYARFLSELMKDASLRVAFGISEHARILSQSVAGKAENAIKVLYAPADVGANGYLMALFGVTAIESSGCDGDLYIP